MSDKKFVKKRTCKKCGKEKFIIEYNKNFFGKVFEVCKTCLMLEKQKEKLKKNKIKNELKILKSSVKTIIDFKYCTKCHNIKEKTNFHNRKNSRDGKSSYCIDCCSLIRKKDKKKINLKRRERLNNNPNERIMARIRTKFSIQLKKCKIEKDDKLLGYTGFTKEQYVSYLKNDYFWQDYLENSEEFHIDHIIPCYIYDFSDKNEIRKCWNPRNLRLLKKHENLKKNKKIDFDLINEYCIQDLLPKKYLTKNKI